MGDLRGQHLWAQKLADQTFEVVFGTAGFCQQSWRFLGLLPLYEGVGLVPPQRGVRRPPTATLDFAEVSELVPVIVARATMSNLVQHASLLQPHQGLCSQKLLAEFGKTDVETFAGRPCSAPLQNRRT